MHVINAISEWAFLLMIAPFAYSFVADFSRMHFSGSRLAYEFESMEEEKKRSGSASDGRGMTPPHNPHANMQLEASPSSSSVQEDLSSSPSNADVARR